MYVCLCNGLNERRIREALAEGVSSVARVYQHLGCAPRCGKCVPLVVDMLRGEELLPQAVPLPEACT